jgi:hypothetical protein
MSPGGSAAAAPSVDGDAHAGLEGPGSIVPGGVAFAPAEFRRRPPAGPSPCAPLRSGGRFAETEIQLHLVGQLIHHDFGVERTLRVTGARMGRCWPVLVDIFVRPAATAIR